MRERKRDGERCVGRERGLGGGVIGGWGSGGWGGGGKRKAEKVPRDGILGTANAVVLLRAHYLLVTERFQHAV